MAARRHYVQIFLISLAALLLEVSYTRVIGFKLFYYFTFLVIGFALLGLGAGGVFVSISKTLREAPADRVLARLGIAGGVVCSASYLLIATVGTNTFGISDSYAEIVPLALLCFGLFASFLVIGIAIARILGDAPEVANQLYFADLVGAALACALAVPLISLLSPPGVIMLASAILVGAGLLLAEGIERPVGAVVGAALLVAAMAPDALLPAPVVDALKTLNPNQIVRNKSTVEFSQWSPVFRVDVLTSELWPAGRKLLSHDGMLGSTLHEFDGDLTKLDRFERDGRALPFKTGQPNPKVLIIGAAGGHEVLASVYFDAEHVTGVELNPITVSLLTDHFADYTGRLAERPEVSLVNDEGRSYLARSTDTFDLIYFVAPDSYTAQNAAASGAYVLSESYLYTREMIAETLEHLSDDGFVCMQFGEFSYDHKPNRTGRYIATARAAFAATGRTDFKNHLAVATTPGLQEESLILLKKSPYTADEIERFKAAVANIEGAQVRYVPGDRDAGDDIVGRVIHSSDSELAAFLDNHSYDLSPVTDDSPFFWHFVRFRDVFADGDSALRNLPDLEDAIGEKVLSVMLGLAAAFATVFLLVPFIAIRDTWRELPYKGRSLVYFGCLGLGFLFFEIVLIQKLTLFLGYPTYSLIVTLLGVLLFSGFGSFLSGRYEDRAETAVWALFGCLVVLTVAYQWVLPAVVGAFGGASLAVRVPVALLFIAPLGLCLGAFMPLGLTTIARTTPHRATYVAWGWAVNGFFSVLSSVLTTILSMAYGFTTVLGLALAAYLVAALSLTSIRRA